MAMKELFTVTLNAKQIREACEAFVRPRIDSHSEEAIAEMAHDLEITVVVRKKRGARKTKTRGNGGVASAGKLSAAEERFG